MTTDEAKEAANALMATVKHLMTGREIAGCEWAKSGEIFDRQEAEESAYREFEEFNVLKRLSIQFSREIANWHDARNLARSRAALKKGKAA